MRKFFSLIAAVLFAGSMMAEAVTLTMEDYAAAEFSDAGISVSTAKNGGSNAPVYNATGKDLRIYAKGSITISAETNISAISFVISTQGKKRLAPLTANVGNVAVAGDPDYTAVWTGSATSVTITVGEKADYGTDGNSKAGQLDFTAIEVTLGEGGGETPGGDTPGGDTPGGDTPGGDTPVVTDPTNCAEAATAALSVSANNELYNGGKSYTIQGYVTSIPYAWKNGNMSFWMADTKDGGEVLEAYKCTVENEADAPAVGDKVAVTGQLTKYNTTPEFAAGCTVAIIEKAGGDTPGGDTPGGDTPGGDTPTAEGIVITPANCGWTTTAGAQAGTAVEGVTISVTNGMASSGQTPDQIRIYKDATLTVSASSNIVSIEFTCTANGTTKYGPGCFAAQEGYTYEAEGKTGTWKGSATSVTFTASTNQVRATQIVVTLEGGEVPPVEPTMDYYVVGSMTDWKANASYKLKANPAQEGEYMADFTFAANDEFKVAYSDGATIEDANWFPQGMDNNYVITEDGDYTVYFRPAGNSEWANGYFIAIKKEAPVVEAITCAAVYDLVKDDAVALNDVVVTFANGKNVWVKDATASMLIYLPASGSFAAGDVLSGVAGTVDIYNGVTEVKPSAEQVEAISATAGEAPAAEVVATVATTDVNKYIVMQNVEAEGTFEEGKQSNLTINGVAVRNQFKNGYTFEAGKAYNVYGVVTIYQNNPQIYFISAEEAGGDTPIEPTVAYYVVGTMTNWEVDETYKLVANPANEGEFMGEFTFADQDELKIVGYDGETKTWYPDGMGNNYNISEQGGDYTVYFRPEGGVDGWYYGFFTLVEKSSGEESTEIIFTREDFIGQGTPNTGSEVTATKSGVTFTCSKAYCAEESLRCYAHGSITISAEATIEKILFTTTGGKTGGLDAEVTVDANSYEVADLASQARFTEIKVILGGGTTGIEETLEEGKAVKVLHEGQILIIKGDHTYTPMGQIVK